MRATLLFITLLVGAALSAASPYVVVLGVAQDGGHPHAGCQKPCCSALWEHPDQGHQVVSLGLVDPDSRQFWIFDATPDFPKQYAYLKNTTGFTFAGIFLTHAHIGHYTGLMYLGQEVMATRKLPVYAMSKMQGFLRDHGPWQQLVTLENIAFVDLKDQEEVMLTQSLRVTPLKVPHRDEYSETVGFRIEGPKQQVLFIPDIDKWSKWNTSINTLIGVVNRAYLDATFYADGEIATRMDLVPHPFVTESLEVFADLDKSDRSKVSFIHLNHTNPLLDGKSPEFQHVHSLGYSVAQERERFAL